VGRALLEVSWGNELVGESTTLDRELKEAEQLISKLSNSDLSDTELTEIKTAFTQVTANFTALKAVTQKRIASADRKSELVGDIFDSYSRLRAFLIPNF